MSFKYTLFTFLFVLCTFFIAERAEAIPAYPGLITVTQADGTPLSIRISGDEYFNYYQTADGYMIKEQEDRNYYYLTLGENNKLISSFYKANNLENRTIEEIAFLQSLPVAQMQQVINETQDETQTKLRTAAISTRLGTAPSIGEQRILIILVEFQNLFFTKTRADFDDMLNKEGYDYNGATGSSRDYFLQNSNGQFDPIFDVYGPIRMPHDVAYYGTDQTNERVRQMIYDACVMLDDEIDFSLYDNDADGLVDNVYVFYAGRGEADGGGASSIWPHSWNIWEFQLELDGVLFGTYACSSELLGQDFEIVGIGPFTHEYSHVLGLPDLYETRSNNGSFTPGAWSILDYGPYNNNQRTPPNFSVYERYALGWIEPVELKDAATIALRTIEHNEGYIIRTENEDEYYLFENRSRTGWDAYLPGEGMLVWHIDYDYYHFTNNIVNWNPNHQRVDLVEADNLQTASSRSGDSFPGTRNIRSFTDDTTPSMRSWGGKPLNTPITEITLVDTLIYFKVKGGVPLNEAPIALPATNIEQIQFVANWTPVTNATRYILSVYSKQPDNSISYVGDFREKTIGNVSSIIIDGVYPGNKYYYTVKACDPYSTTEVSNEIEVIMEDPTFEYYVPTATAATEISKTAFVANWNALDEAVSYILHVYEREITPETDRIFADFTGGLSQLPANWITNCNSVSSVEGNFGQAAPALRLDVDGAYLQSPINQQDITSFSFWYKGSNSDAENSIVIKGSDGNRWIEIYRESPLVNEEGGKSVSLSLDDLRGVKQIAIEFEKIGKGAFFLDDVHIGYGSMVIEHYADGYAGLNVGNVLSYQVEGLDETKIYYYAVRAFDGTKESLSSNEVQVELNDASTIRPIESQDIKVTLGKDYIFIDNPKRLETELNIYNVTGRKIYTFRISGDHKIENKQFEDKGVLILSVGNKNYKLIR